MTGPVFRAVLPLPPSVNESLRPAVIGWKGGKPVMRLVKTREAESFEAACRAELRRLQPPLALHRGVLSLCVTFYVTSLSSDVGNREKLLADACKGLAMHDDRQIAELRLLRRVDADNPRAELELRHADPAEHQDVAERLALAEKKLGPPAYFEPRQERAKARAEKRGVALKFVPAPAYRPPKT